MILLPFDASNNDLIEFIDGWAALLDAEDYRAAYDLTEHDSTMHWTSEMIREVIKAYGEGASGQKVTLSGQPTDIVQRKQVMRWKPNASGSIGQILYDLNIDGFASDLTATFW